MPPTSGFADDDGRAAPALVRALARAAADGARVVDVVAALAEARVLVPVLAEAEVVEKGAEGLAVDRTASTGVVALRTPDGRTALPVFSDVAAMAAWHRGARPVPAEGPRAAASALQEGWEVLVVDPAGPAVVVPHPALRALASGRPWTPAVVDGGVRRELSDVVATALADVEEVRRAHLEPGRRAEVAVVLALRPGLDRARLDAVLARVGERLAEAELAAQVDTLEVRVVTATARP
nr:SseB family protein [Cellulomonas sp. APG4]